MPNLYAIAGKTSVWNAIKDLILVANPWNSQRLYNMIFILDIRITAIEPNFFVLLMLRFIKLYTSLNLWMKFELCPFKWRLLSSFLPYSLLLYKLTDVLVHKVLSMTV